MAAFGKSSLPCSGLEDVNLRFEGTYEAGAIHSVVGQILTIL
jgi:hypothetical protein